MERVLIHPLAGVLSAYGIGQAELRALRESSVELALSPEGLAEAELALAGLEEDAGRELRFQHSETERVIRKFHVRYRGTNTALPVEPGSIANITEAFQAAHRSRFGFTMDPDERGLVIAAVSVEAIGGGRNELLLVREELGSTLGNEEIRMSGSSTHPGASTKVRFA